MQFHKIWDINKEFEREKIFDCNFFGDAVCASGAAEFV